MKPEPSALMSFSRRIGSPPKKSLRDDRAGGLVEAVRALGALDDGRSAALSAGQACQRRSAALSLCPIGMSAAATSTSTVRMVGGASTTDGRRRRLAAAHHEHGGAARDERDAENRKAGWFHGGWILDATRVDPTRISAANRQSMVNRTYPNGGSGDGAAQALRQALPERGLRVDEERRAGERDAVGHARLRRRAGARARPSAARRPAAAAARMARIPRSARRRRAAAMKR